MEMSVKMAKPGKGSQTKGKRGENEVVALFKECMKEVELKRSVDTSIAPSTKLYRNLDQYSGDKSGDIDVPLFCVEVKFAEKLLLPKWWKQAVEQADSVGKHPLLFYRSARLQWRVRMNHDLTKTLYKGLDESYPRCNVTLDLDKREFFRYYSVLYESFLWSVGL